ncbi:MAG: hypothetical protein Tsb002_28210 [Wenzhouxiangellaceae bacterium]
MAKKSVKKTTGSAKASAKSSVKTVLDPVVDSARDIWLAGLGAFAVAQEEGNKVVAQGTKMFDQLVKEGTKLEEKTRKAANEAADDVKGGFESRVQKVRTTATSNWDKLEKVFEERVAKALGRLGVPTADEVQELIKKVEQLSKEVRALNQSQTTSKTSPKSAA